MATSCSLSFEADHIYLRSGAIGTYLRQSAPGPEPVELLNVRMPEAVRAMHTAYREAGAEILVTNTFAAHRIGLEETDAAACVAEINRRGVTLAREAGGETCRIWASIGPLNLGLREEDFSDALLEELYAEVCSALVEADALLLETFVSPREARAALRAAKATGRPVIFQIGRTGASAESRARAEQMLREAVSTGVAAVGVNCLAPDEIGTWVQWLVARTALPVCASPNAGQPHIERGRVRYAFTPQQFARVGESLVEAGAVVIGGCCGTTPDHIRALAETLRGRAPVPRPVPVTTAITAEAPAPAPPLREPASPNPVRERLRATRPLICIELRADRLHPLSTLLKKARAWADQGADLFSVPDNPGATVSRDALIAAARVQNETAVPAIAHLVATHANLLHHYARLLGAGDLGVRGVLALTGDAPSVGPLGAWAHRVTDVRSSVELLRLIRALGEGRLMSGETVADPPELCAGCAFAQPTTGQLRWLRAKIAAGAEFVFTQPVFRLAEYERLRDSLADCGARVFFGLLPLISARAAARLAEGRIPGLVVPPETVAELQRFGDAADQRRYGVERALELLARIRAEGRDVYLVPPFGQHSDSVAARLLEGARQLASP